MRKLSIIALIALQFFSTVASLDSSLWKRQSNNTSPSPSPPLNSSTITDALNQDGIPSLCDQECVPAYNTTLVRKNCCSVKKVNLYWEVLPRSRLWVDSCSKLFPKKDWNKHQANAMMTTRRVFSTAFYVRETSCRPVLIQFRKK